MLHAGAVAVSRPFVPTPSSPPKKPALLHRMRNKLQRIRKGKTRADTPESTFIASPTMTAVLDLIQSPTNLQIALIQLQNRSLIKRREHDGESSLWIHDLIQLLVLENTKRSGGERAWFECAVKLVCTAFEQIGNPQLPSSWRQCEVYVSHIQSLTGRDKISNRARDSLIVTNCHILEYLHARGRYNDAQTLGERLLSQQLQIYGSEHVDVLTTMQNLARVYKSQGRYTEAEKLYNRVLRSREQQLGSDHVDVLTTMQQSGFRLLVSGPLRRSREVVQPSVAQSGATAWIRPRRRTHHNAQSGFGLLVSGPLRRSRGVVQPSVAQSGATAWIRPC